MNLTRILFLIAAAIGTSLLPACGGGGGGGGGTSSAQDDAQLLLWLTDAANEKYQAVYVTVDEVQVHRAGGTWRKVADPDKTYDLLELVNGVREELGLALLPAGQYTQLRLLLKRTPDQGTNLLSRSHPFANYVIDQNDVAHELTVPSGFQTGIKLVHGFTLTKGVTTELVLDFDVDKSIVEAGNSGKRLLKPTIKVVDLKPATVIGGAVTPVDRAGARVTAQVYVPQAADVKDQVKVQAGTVTNLQGVYTLIVPPGPYNLVATKGGYRTECAAVIAPRAGVLRQNFAFSAAAEGTVAGTVTVAGGVRDLHVSLSFRQNVLCPGNSARQDIEVASTQVVNGAGYSIKLPAGTYNAVVWTEGKPTRQAPVTVTANQTTKLDVSY